MNAWWHQPIDEVARVLESHPERGLTTAQSLEKAQTFGPNQLKQAPPVSAWVLFLQQFKGVMIAILVGAAVISLVVHEISDAVVILIIVVLNALLGFIQEFRAEKSLTALKKLASPMAKVVRNGSHQVIPSSQLVPGDLIELEAGDHIPADGRLVWITAQTRVQEASLTGESTAVGKTLEPLDEKTTLADRINMIYMGTSITNGRARALVTATGMHTELGHIADLIEQVHEDPTPLQRKLEQFGRKIVVVCLVLVGLIFGLGWLHGGELKEILLSAISLAVAAIPEGLPAVVTIALALGVQRMVKRNVLIRKLPSVETLGCATVICSDKTGTLTKNEMTVQAVYAGRQWFEVTGQGYAPQGQLRVDGRDIAVTDYPDLSQLLKIGQLCNGAQLVHQEGAYHIVGDPTEGCLITAATKAGVLKDELERAHPVIDEIPFDSDRKKMTVLRQVEGRACAFIKGAPDLLLQDCSHIQIKGEAVPLTDEHRQAIAAANHQLASRAMRVLAGAYRLLDQVPSDISIESVERQLVFVGLFGMMDPPREEARAAIAQCRSAGIRPVMMTGDHKATAVAIARQLGCFDETSLALSGSEIDALSDTELAEKVEQIAVYARVSPEHKIRVVRAWRSRGQVVGMTGDGVNDAPALKEADIGVAMGITGTDVTKEVADMVVTDDNFASIVAAVEEGRGVYDNIRKFIHYLLSCNAGEILVMLLASLLGWPVPLLAIHILWVNLITDGLPALALGVEPLDPLAMQRPPRDPAEPVVTRSGGIAMLLEAAIVAFCTLIAFAVVWHQGDDPAAMVPKARTVAFVVLACSQLFHSFNCRHFERSLFKIKLWTNPYLVGAVLLSLAIQVTVVHVPWLQRAFKTTALSLTDWGWLLLISSLPLWLVEGYKRVVSSRLAKEH